MFTNIETLSSLLHEVNLLSIIIRISMALLIGGIFGAERGLRNRPAGFMTYVLVCMGATMVMLTNQYIFTIYAQSNPIRLAAQVVSGIGFLGAGAIIGFLFSVFALIFLKKIDIYIKQHMQKSIVLSFLICSEER